MIAICDYGAGNLLNVYKALQHLGAACSVTSDPTEITKAQAVILPGVGAFGDAMKEIHKRGLYDVLRKAADGNKPFLGICLGLQLLFSKSEESPGVKGLCVLPGEVKRFPMTDRKVPHMGWNDITIRPGTTPVFDGVTDGTFVYFVHSYYCVCKEENDVSATTEYGIRYHSAAARGLLTATQFHPEKSGEAGLLILENFVKSV
ncbi:MAG: imidazole glycerol phosphate synthase subunit HisH [Oscillospiraceae bacterium]|jgi:glutamine amidotransferase|nr:imidazole glycerol phosphate synthase subunit HisH [Oscillospiraceae bacterium]